MVNLPRPGSTKFLRTWRSSLALTNNYRLEQKGKEDQLPQFPPPWHLIHTHALVPEDIVPALIWAKNQNHAIKCVRCEATTKLMEQNLNSVKFDNVVSLRTSP
jgi:hypothetical protein